MNGNHNKFDVAEYVDTTDPVSVNAEVNRIFRELYVDTDTATIDRAFRDIESLYRGKFPGYHPCDTPYHDVQHVLDVTLAMARLLDGYARARSGDPPFGRQLFRLGVVTALFHDCGYVRTLDDNQHCNGGELTLIHVSRGAEFLRRYLPTIGMGEMADIAAALIHFTGYEKPVSAIEVPSLRYKILGGLLGSADIIAQMSDRCYLEKCRDRLYPEFVAGGIAVKRHASGREDVLFESGDDLVMKTPRFYESARLRLERDLGNCYAYAEHHFGGVDLYFESINRNIRFAQAIAGEHDTSSLRRIPPVTLDLHAAGGAIPNYAAINAGAASPLIH